MKKLILMTSALVLAGGAAVAQDITISAEATVSYGNWETAPGTDAAFDFGTELVFSLEASTAGGTTYGGEMTIEDDNDNVRGVIWVSTGLGKFSFGVDEFGELNADDIPAMYDDVNGDAEDSDYADVRYEGTFGDFSVAFEADGGAGITPGDGSIAAGSATWWAEAKYSGAGFSVGLETDSNQNYDLSASADVGGFTIGASVDEATVVDVYGKGAFGGVNVKVTADDVTGGAIVYGIELDGSAGDIEWAAAVNTDEDMSASVKYTMGDLSVGLAYDNDDAGSAVGPVDPAGLVAGGLGVADRGDEADLILTIGYGMDNLDFELKYNDVQEYEISMTAGFEF